jgi:hypothetical protein
MRDQPSLVPSAPVSPFWIAFDEARRAVETIVEVAHDEPDERPTCIVLAGRSGMGKTSILREVQKRLQISFPRPADWGDARFQPMIRAIVPSSPTSLKINMILLWKQGWPIRGNTYRIADTKVIELIRAQGTRLVAIDQVHAILTVSGKARRDTLDAFRFLMSEGNIPLVVAGLDRAADILEADEELALRSIMLRLSPWAPGEPTQRLIRSMARGMGLNEPEGLAEGDRAARISAVSSGVTGNFKRLLHWANKVAQRRGAQVIGIDDINEAVRLFPPYPVD